MVSLVEVEKRLQLYHGDAAEVFAFGLVYVALFSSPRHPRVLPSFRQMLHVL